MTPFECYKLYLSLKRHFTSSYDYFYYQGKISASEKSFESRNDRYFFQKMAKHRDPLGLMVANFLHTPKMWIKELAYSETAEKTYMAWLKNQQSLTRVFTQDLKKLLVPFGDNFKHEMNEHPPLLNQYLQEEISFETLSILLMTTKWINKWDENLPDPIWQDVSTKIRKHYGFMSVDEQKFMKLVVDAFRS